MVQYVGQFCQGENRQAMCDEWGVIDFVLKKQSKLGLNSAK